MSLVHLTIDGKKIAVAPGTTILKAAQEAGIFIPTLCYLEGINEVGACHMCSHGGAYRHAQDKEDEGGSSDPVAAGQSPSLFS